MKALVLFESYFGNTEKVARAVADALSSKADVTVERVDGFDPKNVKGYDFLLLASPTRGFAPGDAMKAFLNRLPAGTLHGVKAAVLDTRIDPNGLTSKVLRFLVKSFGYADKAMTAALEKSGAELTSPAQGFIVLDREGPLKGGELERASEWAKTLI